MANTTTFRPVLKVKYGREVVPLLTKGSKIKRAMMDYYGQKKGERVFYASENKGILGKGVVKGGSTGHRKKRGRLGRLGQMIVDKGTGHRGTGHKGTGHLG